MVVDVGGVRQLSARVLHRHEFSDVAILMVPALRNVQHLAFGAAPPDAASCSIVVGYADPDDLFPGINACKKYPDISPGSIVEDDEPVGTNAGVDVSKLLLQLVSIEGMSGSPILDITGVIGMMTGGDGDYTTGVTVETILQVLKRFYRKRLRGAQPSMSRVQLDAQVNPMDMQQVLAALS